MSRVPKPSQTIRSKLKAHERELRRIRSNSAFDNSGQEVSAPGEVVQGGSVTIPEDGTLLVDGGEVVMLDAAPSATPLFTLGVQDYGDRGLTLRRNDDTVALVIKDEFGNGTQSMKFYDRAGQRIGGDSLLSPSGFDVPHINMPFIPVDYTSGATAQSTSSGTFVATHEYRGFKQNPAFKPQFMVMCSDATTAAEVQVWNVINAVYLGGLVGSPAVHTITVPAGTTTFTLFEFSSAAAIPGDTSAALHFEIHARITAGGGSVTVAPVRTVGSGF